MSEKPKGPFTLWQEYGHEGWYPEDFATLSEAIERRKDCTNWVITRPVRYVVSEEEGHNEWKG